MLKKLFTLIAAFAMTLGMVISAPVVHAEEIIYPTGISGSSKGMRRILLELGVPYDLDKYVQSIVLPEGATVNENTVVYSLADDEENVLVLNDNRTVVANEEGSGIIYVNFKDSSGALTGNSVAICAVATTRVTGFSYEKSDAEYVFDPEAEQNIVYASNQLKTIPKIAIEGIYFTDIEYSTSDESIASYEYDINHGLRLIAKKAGKVTVYAKYNGFVASYQLTISNKATKMECPDEFVTYPGYYPPLEIQYGEGESKTTRVEVLEGAEYIKNPVDGEYYNGYFNVTGAAPGKAVVRFTNVSNPSLTKDVTITVLEGMPDPKLNYTLNVYEMTDNGNVLLPQSDQYDLLIGNRYMFEFISKYGYDKYLPKFALPFEMIGGSTGDMIYTFEYRIDKEASCEFAFPAYTITFNGIDKETDNPVIENISEDTKVEISDSISKDEVEQISTTLSKAEVKNILKVTDLKELLKESGITGTSDQVKVVNSVTVKKSSLSDAEGSISITYEITPFVVVTTGGIDKTIKLGNKFIDGDVQITLPLNGIKLKEIIHESVDGKKEYIYSKNFIINAEDDTVTFSVNHFSSFTLNEVVTKPSTTVSPNTGDHTEVLLYGGMGIVAVIGAVALILFRRKHA